MPLGTNASHHLDHIIWPSRWGVSVPSFVDLLHGLLEKTTNFKLNATLGSPSGVNLARYPGQLAALPIELFKD